MASSKRTTCSLKSGLGVTSQTNAGGGRAGGGSSRERHHAEAHVKQSATQFLFTVVSLK